MKLLDSNTVIQYLKGHEGVISKVKTETDIAVPSIVVYEIEVGTIQSKQTGTRRRVLSELFHEMEIAPFDSSAALAAARIRCELESRGEGIGPMDTLIAGIALSRGAILITSNVGEFKRIKGLRIEDWKI